MSMAIKGLCSSDWLHTQTLLPRISFHQPWHRWHRIPPLCIFTERKRRLAQKRREAKNEVVRQQQNTNGAQKRGTSDIFILLECTCLAALVGIWMGVAQTHKDQKETVFYSGTRSKVSSWRQCSFPNINSLLFWVTLLLFLLSVSLPHALVFDLSYFGWHTDKIQTLSLFHRAPSQEQLLVLNWFGRNYVMPVSWANAYHSVSCLGMYSEWERVLWW